MIYLESEQERTTAEILKHLQTRTMVESELTKNKERERYYRKLEQVCYQIMLQRNIGEHIVEETGKLAANGEPLMTVYTYRGGQQWVKRTGTYMKRP